MSTCRHAFGPVTLRSSKLSLNPPKPMTLPTLT